MGTTERMDSLLEAEGVYAYVISSSVTAERISSNLHSVRQALERSAQSYRRGDRQMARAYAGVAAYLAYQNRNLDELAAAVRALKPLM